MTNKYKLKEVTPTEMMCGVGACPAIYEVEEITPAEMQCSPLPLCPGIYSEKTGESYLIIGEQVNPSDAGLERKVGKNEVLIKVPKELIDNKR